MAYFYYILTCITFARDQTREHQEEVRDKEGPPVQNLTICCTPSGLGTPSASGPGSLRAWGGGATNCQVPHWRAILFLY